jgi:hypothetical protein
MQKNAYLLALIIFSIIQTEPAIGGVTRTASFQISVIMPEHVMSNNALDRVLSSNNSNQIIQTQMVIRNNQRISLTSIVVA